MNLIAAVCSFIRQFSAVVLALALIAGAVSPAFASDEARYKVRQVVAGDDGRPRETDAVVVFGEKTMTVVPGKKKLRELGVEVAYENVGGVEYSYSTEPIMSRTTAVALSLIGGFMSIAPLMFIKKKSHYLSLRTGDQFVVLKLKKGTLRKITAELAKRQIAISDPEEDAKRIKP